MGDKDIFYAHHVHRRKATASEEQTRNLANTRPTR